MDNKESEKSVTSNGSNWPTALVLIMAFMCFTSIYIFTIRSKPSTPVAEATSIPEIVLTGENVRVKFVGQLPNSAKPISVWGYFYNGGWHIVVGDDKSNIWALEWGSSIR
ncbi:MAG: hypothetical protein QXR60_02345 [Candidatus Nanoarchaeia archaeon]